MDRDGLAPAEQLAVASRHCSCAERFAWHAERSGGRLDASSVT
jgi:hypothetical protein